MPLKEGLRVSGIQNSEERRSRDKGGGPQAAEPEPRKLWGVPDGPGLTGGSMMGGTHAESGGGREPATELPPRSPGGRSATPGREAVPRTKRGHGCHGAGRGGGDSGPAPSPAGQPAPDGPGPPAGAGGLRQGEAIVLLPRRRSPAARARAPPRAPPRPAPRAPRAARAP